MAATYTPDATEHGLSAEAQALDAGRLANEVLAAEQVLGLAGVTLDGDDIDKAKLAVARQVNLQVRLASGSGDIRSESRGRQSVTYATINGVRLAVDSLAQSIVAGLLGPPAQSTVAEATFRW